jgi:hypothetical protein
MSHRPTRMHCALDWLGRITLVLVMIAGAVYVYKESTAPHITCTWTP